MKRSRLDDQVAAVLKKTVGACPACAMYVQGFFSWPVIYRRSPRSITMRCQTCGLQWTMTLAKINRAVSYHASTCGDGEIAKWLYEGAATLTEAAAKREERGRTRG